MNRSSIGAPAAAECALREPAESLAQICVCICTYKRPRFLARLLEEISAQETDGRFVHSIVVVDNDAAESAGGVVSDFRSSSVIPIRYYIESRQNIALARNKAIENAEGDYVALIDDDEFPTRRWLLTLLQACERYRVDGVLGPVAPWFEAAPPAWVSKGKFYERRRFPSGRVLDWGDGRTGNALLKRSVFPAGEGPFRQEFRAGEDQDFFRRAIERGHVFVWCDEAVAYEVVPPLRWEPIFMLRRALLRGACASLHPLGFANVAKSLIALPAYTAALPFASLLGRHRWMGLLVRICDHLGKLLALAGVNPIKQPYVTK